MTEPLKSEELYSCCDPELFPFTTTDDLPDYGETIGQERALSAIDFGLNLDSKGFNIFILGENGTGKSTTIRSILGKKSADEPVPQDWCYVYNFEDADVPLAIPMASGTAVDFHKDMEELVKVLRVEIPKMFESKEYEKQRNKILEEFQQKQKQMFSGLEEEAQAKGFSIRKSVSGLMIVPVKKSGEPLTEEEYEALDDAMKAKIDELGRGLQERLNDVVREVREIEKGVKKALSQLERDATLAAVGHLMDDLKTKYSSHEKITSYLNAVTEDILSHIEDFSTQEEQAPQMPFAGMRKPEPTFTRYTVNVLVNNRESQGSPCVFESNPTYLNLFGRLEYKFQYGVAVTDFSMIKAGALHKANGGYLVINALDLLRNVMSYDTLKRALRNREIRIEDVWEQYRLVSTTTLRPEPIPLNVKVILIGNPNLYYMLYSLDEEYRELFKVKADFDSRMTKTKETMHKYAAFVASTCRNGGLMPFGRTGVAKIVEYGSRLADHQEKLSSRFSDIADVVREANYWAKKAGSAVVTDDHVEQALREKVFRTNRIEERLQEMIVEGTIIVDTAGEKVGQINGLAVLGLGDYQFGKPSRITARTYTGKSGVVNIERETKMSGRIHDKAVLIISHYINSTFAWKKPISFSASITFEQLYDMVEGDSASCAELFAILSSLAGVPLKQYIAVTGSMDQNGDVQPIGGINEKIEGFFDLCKVRGLDGTQGIVMPRKNVRNLMIKKEVVDAVKDGKFFIYPIDRVEEGLQIFTGLHAGVRSEDGTFPEGTLYHLVEKRLAEIAAAMKDKKEDQKDNGKENGREKENNKE
ncbi:MAG: ATP-binding protein [Nitrospiraceae bacterium]|nr:ATP-binding protein [Nitrospiraceae bacterium]